MAAIVRDLSVLAVARTGASIVEVADALDLNFGEASDSFIRLRDDRYLSITADGKRVESVTSARNAAIELADELEAADVMGLPDDLPAAPFLVTLDGFLSRASLETFGDAFPRAFNVAWMIDQVFANITRCDPSLRYAGNPDCDTLIVACIDDSGRTGVCRSYTYSEFDVYTIPAELIASIRTIVAKTLRAAGGAR